MNTNDKTVLCNTKPVAFMSKQININNELTNWENSLL